MTRLLDTDTCIYWLNGRPEIREQALAINLERSEQFAEQFEGAIAIIPPTTATLKKFGGLKASLRRSGQPIADFDLMIASTALSEQQILVTNNTRHYERIPDLALENWGIRVKRNRLGEIVGRDAPHYLALSWFPKTGFNQGDVNYNVRAIYIIPKTIF